MDIHKIFSNYFKDPKVRSAAEIISQRLEEGHICLYERDEKLQDEGIALRSDLSANPWVGTPDDTSKPFILDGDRLYLQRYWTYETAILDKIQQLLSIPLSSELEETYAFVQKTASPPSAVLPFPLDLDWQSIAVLHALHYRFTIITGGPGTGKTTSVARILAAKLIQNPDLNIALAAPTGKAAARMNQALSNATQKMPIEDAVRDKIHSLEASTIHRLLVYRQDSGQFKHNSSTPLPYDLIVVDEASMMDASLMAKLLAAVRSESQLLFLGDRNQLASVEAGSIFGDLCNSAGGFPLNPRDMPVFYRSYIAFPQNWSPPPADRPNLLTGHVLPLHFSHRFDATEGIGQFSRQLLAEPIEPRQLIDPFLPRPGRKDPLVILPSLDHPLWDAFLEGYTRYAKEKDTAIALQKLGEIRVLCALHDGPMGTHALNALIHSFLASKGLLGVTRPHYHNQPIQMTANDYNLQLFNGDEGLIQTDPETGELMAWFPGEGNTLRAFPPSTLKAFNTAFAMTIYKSQGSEYDRVAVCLPKISNRILTRELLYTAVTRARDKVLLISGADILLEAARHPTERMSGIIPRVQARPSTQIKFPSCP